MKIGILTFHRSHNYGAVLQVYGLKTYLSELGHKVEIIDYWPKYREGMYDLPDFKFLKEKNSLFKNLKSFIRHILIYPEKLIRYNRFQNFIENRFKVYNKSVFNDGDKIPLDLDLYIYGSDQIWRFNDFENFHGFDPVYWGRYPEKTNSKKISYAASMGKMDIDDNQLRFIEDHIDNFSTISVREKSLKIMIEPLTEMRITHVLDPVFLLDSDRWLTISSNYYKPKQDYILLYHLLYSREALELAKKLAKRMNYRIIEIKGGVEPLKNPYRFKQAIGPEEFISLISNAKFVISTSFHGVAFSLLFEKQFFALGMGNNSTRVTDLLDKLEISERYIENFENTDLNNIEEIDYQAVSPLLNKEKKKSTYYLKNNLEIK